MPGFTLETSAVRWKAWLKNGCQKSLSFRYMFISFQYIWKMYLDTLSHRVLVFPDFLLLKFSSKKFSWNNKMIPLLGNMNKNWKWQNHAFYYSLILSFELYNFIEVMPSVLMAVIKVESFISLSCINCLIKMTQPWPNG